MPNYSLFANDVEINKNTFSDGFSLFQIVTHITVITIIF